jgi:hypothetical protein
MMDHENIPYTIWQQTMDIGLDLKDTETLCLTSRVDWRGIEFPFKSLYQVFGLFNSPRKELGTNFGYRRRDRNGL